MNTFEQMYKITKVQLANALHERDGYRRMAEYAAIMAVCGYFSRMRGPIGHLVRNALLGSEDFVRGEAYELDDCEIAVPLYAGSAPVPAAEAEVADALEHAGTRAEFHPDSEIAVLCRKAAAVLRARAVPAIIKNEDRNHE